MKNELITSKVINTSIIVIAVIACFMQLIIDDTTENIASACIVLTASLSVMIYLRASKGFDNFPITSFAIFGFCATTQLGALLVQSFTLNSLAHDLRQPMETFFTLLLFQWIAIAAHMTYRYFSSANLPLSKDGKADAMMTNFSLRRLLIALGVYDVPTVHQLWIMGVVGLFAVLMTGNAHVNTGIENKVSAGIGFIAWAPFLIPVFVVKLGKKYCDVKFHYTILAAYMGLIGLIGIAANARTMIVSGVTTIGMVVLLLAMRNNNVAKPASVVKVALMLAICAAMLIPVSQLALAMVVVRESHSSNGAAYIVKATIDTMMKPELLQARRDKEKLAARFKPYDEYYIENPVLARFVMTKFHDNALFFENRLNDQEVEELWDTTVDLLWTILPDPVLKFLDVKVNKTEMEFTLGDYLYHQGAGGSLGGYKYGSIFGHGIGLFGWLFTIVYFGICLVTFWILEFLALRNKDGSVSISVVGMLVIWRLYFYGLTSDSLKDTILFLLREIPQSIVVFVIAYQASRLLTYPIRLLNKYTNAKVYTGKRISAG